uniref:MalY/PatB family protein n=1 Tax=Vaginimicrobium propionicum TaxID=1871034 RepID=UPI0009708CFA|nr:aminotransferase class I/II-fold pyridoxal phosphate-dependent enzyme [Vaginimicrobium propionicum]
MNSNHFVADVEARTPADLVAAGSLKWTAFPGAYGAWVAEMDFGLAPAVRSAVMDYLSKEQTGYAPVWLREELKTATVEWLADRFDWQVAPERVHWLPDVLTGLTMTLSYLARPGKVIVPTPCYMPFVDIPATCGRGIIQVPMIRTETGWEFDFAALDEAFTDGGVVLVLCNPHNPIGKVVTPDEMAEITRIVDRHDGLVFSDEIHAPLVLDGKHTSYAATSPAAANHTVTAVAASKSFNIAGLKCAQLIVTNDAQQHWFESRGHGLVHESSPVGMVATLAAYREGKEWLGQVVDYLRGNRDLVTELVESKLPGVKMIPAEATYLAWLDVRGLNLADPRQHFLDHGVALTDGRECGDAGKGHIRLCFATARPVLRAIFDRMAASLKN